MKIWTNLGKAWCHSFQNLFTFLSSFSKIKR